MLQFSTHLLTFCQHSVELVAVVSGTVFVVVVIPQTMQQVQ